MFEGRKANFFNNGLSNDTHMDQDGNLEDDLPENVIFNSFMISFLVYICRVQENATKTVSLSKKSAIIRRRKQSEEEEDESMFSMFQINVVFKVEIYRINLHVENNTWKVSYTYVDFLVSFIEPVSVIFAVLCVVVCKLNICTLSIFSYLHSTLFAFINQILGLHIQRI